MLDDENIATPDAGTSERVSLGTANSSTERDARTRQSRGFSMKQAMQSTETDRSASRGRSHVEKTIEVTLPKTEQLTNARTRKSSHYMGLFRENTAPGDLDSTQVVHTGSAEKLGRVRLPSRESSGQTLGASPFSDSRDDARTASFGDEQYSQQEETSNLDEGLSLKAQNLHLRDVAQAHPLSHQQAEPTTAEFIHRLTPETEDKRSTQRLDARGTHPRTKAVLTPNAEVEDEEHMSKVEYKPHTVRGIEQIDDIHDIDHLDHKELAESGEVTSDEIAPYRDKPRVATRTPPSEHIDISIESKHEKRTFHGSFRSPDDLESATDKESVALASISESYDAKASSASETEFESGEEDTLREEGNDGETTPTTETEPPKYAKRRRKSTSTQPKAVILDPYSHQVGGHSTMFRFSRQAVCKQLNNRENQFYERIEVRHPELLRFLPRYDNPPRWF